MSHNLTKAKEVAERLESELGQFQPINDTDRKVGMLSAQLVGIIQTL